MAKQLEAKINENTGKVTLTGPALKRRDITSLKLEGDIDISEVDNMLKRIGVDSIELPEEIKERTLQAARTAYTKDSNALDVYDENGNHLCSYSKRAPGEVYLSAKADPIQVLKYLKRERDRVRYSGQEDNRLGGKETLLKETIDAVCEEVGT